MMELSSPVSPGGSVLDRVLLFEKIEKEVTTRAAPPPRINTKSPKNESHKHLEAPFSPARRISRLDELSVGTLRDKATIPTSPYNKSPSSEVHEVKPFNFSKSPTSEQSPNHRQFTFPKSPKSDLTPILKPVSFSKSSTLDLPQTTLKPVTFSKRNPGFEEISDMKKVSFSNNSASDQMPKLKPVNFTKNSAGQQSFNIKPVTYNKSPTNQTYNSEPDTFSESPTANRKPNLKSVSFLKSPTETGTINPSTSSKGDTSADETLVKKPVTFSKSPTAAELSNLKPFPVTFRAIASTNKEPSPSFKKRWPINGLREVSEEAVVEEMPWPSEGLEEFPNVSWLSSGDDVEESVRDANSLSSFSIDKRMASSNSSSENESNRQKKISLPSTNKPQLKKYSMNAVPHTKDRKAAIPSYSKSPSSSQQSPRNDYTVAFLDAGVPKANKTDSRRAETIDDEGSSKDFSISEDEIQPLHRNKDQDGRIDFFVREYAVPTKNLPLTGSEGNFSNQASATGSFTRLPEGRNRNRIHNEIQVREEEEEKRPIADDAMTVTSSVTSRSNLTFSTDTSNPLSPRVRRIIQVQELEDEREEELQKGAESPARLARNIRASRLRSRHSRSPMRANTFSVKASELPVPAVKENLSFKTSDFDGPPKITIEPGKLTAGIRPRSRSPSFASPWHSSPLQISKKENASSGNSAILGSDYTSVIVETTTNSVYDRGANKNGHDPVILVKEVTTLVNSSEKQNEVQEHADHLFQDTAEVIQSGDDDVENRNLSQQYPDFTKESVSNQAHYKVPRSVANRRERLNGQYVKNINRSPMKPLAGASSHEEDIYSVGTDTTPITRPGRPPTAVNTPHENLHSQSQLLDKMASGVNWGNEYNDLILTGTKENDIMQPKFTTTITEEIITFSNNSRLVSSHQHHDEIDPFGLQEKANTNKMSSPQNEIFEAVVEEDPKVSHNQVVASPRSGRVEIDVMSGGEVEQNIVLTSSLAVLNDNLSLWMQNRKEYMETQNVEMQQENISTNLNKKSTRKKMKNRKDCGPTVESSSVNSQTTSESKSVYSAADDLASWWQNTYAATQQPEVNKLVEHALLEQTASPNHSSSIDRKTAINSPKSSHAKKISPRRSAKNILSDPRSPSVYKKSSSSNEGDSEGGSRGLLVNSKTSSPASSGSKHSHHETDDDDVFSGIEDDDRTLDSKTYKSSLKLGGSTKNQTMNDIASVDISVKATSTCDDTHTADLLNSLDEDNPRLTTPMIRFFPLSPRETSSRSDRNRRTGKRSPEIKTQQVESISNVGQKIESVSASENEKEVDVQEAGIREENPECSPGGLRISANQLFEQFSCAFLEGIVIQFCQDPKAATGSMMAGLFEHQQPPSGNHEEISDVQNEDEAKDEAEDELGSSLSEKEKDVWKVWEDNGVGSSSSKVNSDLMSSDIKVSDESSQEKNLTEESIDESNSEQHVAGYAENSSSIIAPPPSLQLISPRSSPKRLKVFTMGKFVTSPKKMASSPQKSVTSLVTPRSSRAGQKQLLDRFCSKLRNDGMEVLKLNSEKVWQTRFLTVSKEVITLTDESNDESEKGYCPKGLLWVKKFPSNKEQSASVIEKTGKGGMLFSQIISVEELAGRQIAMSKKQHQGKFKDSVIVVLKGTEESGSKMVYLRCSTRQEALVLCAGCNMIAKMLRAAKNQTLTVQSINKDDPTNNEVVECMKVETEGDNDLWEV